MPMSSPMVADYFVHPFGNPDLADGFGSTGYWEGGQWVTRKRPHRGLDYPQAEGAVIPATAHGIVAGVFWSDALGHVTVIEHHRPDDRPTVFSGYCHQSAQHVKEGDLVTRGQSIGEVGSTGTEAGGDHLHFTMSHHLDGVTGPSSTFDPALFIANNDRQTLGDLKVRPKYARALRGDSLWLIADRAGVSLSTIKKLNPQVKPPGFVIRPHDKIRVR